MFEASARNLRTVERFLLAPPLPADFSGVGVSISDISARGARFRHDVPLDGGHKGVFKIPIEGRQPLALEAVVVWSQSDSSGGARFVSGVRTYGSPEAVQGLIQHLQQSNRSNRIEELRASDRFFVKPMIDSTFDGHLVKIENLSARGAGIVATSELGRGETAPLTLSVEGTQLEVPAKVCWVAVKAITGAATLAWRAGLTIGDKHEKVRLAIAHLSEKGAAVLDTQSLGLKLKILRARARQFASSVPTASGVPPEQYLLVNGVREELRLNPEEAMHWYRRARLIINDPATKSTAPEIASHPDALAVWEYLDRSIDPTVVARALGLA